MEESFCVSEKQFRIITIGEDAVNEVQTGSHDTYKTMFLSAEISASIITLLLCGD